MNEIFYNLTHPLPNAVTTAIMGVLAVYWLFTFLSGIGFEDVDLGFDFDVDVDTPDMDADADVDADGAAPDDVQAGESPGFLCASFSL